MKIDWTPTADRLPDKARAYLVTAIQNENSVLSVDGEPFVDVMYFFADEGCWSLRGYDVLAWAERPDPWEREDGEEE